VPKTGRRASPQKFNFEGAIGKSSTLKLKGAKTHMNNTPLYSEMDKDEMKEDEKLKKTSLKFDIMHFFKTFKDEKKTTELPNLPLCDEEA